MELFKAFYSLIILFIVQIVKSYLEKTDISLSFVSNSGENISARSRT